MFEAISNNTKLQYLDISGNIIVDLNCDKYPEFKRRLRGKASMFGRGNKIEKFLNEEADGDEEESVEEIQAKLVEENDDDD